MLKTKKESKNYGVSIKIEKWEIVIINNYSIFMLKHILILSTKICLTSEGLEIVIRSRNPFLFQMIFLNNISSENSVGYRVYFKFSIISR